MTDRNKIEPVGGFGTSPFGHPTNSDTKEFERGFGDPTTPHTAEASPDAVERNKREPKQEIGAGMGPAGNVEKDGHLDEFGHGAGDVPTDRTESEPSVIGTTKYQIEPLGFGLSAFGDPKSSREHSRGFGDPTTKHTEITTE